MRAVLSNRKWKLIMLDGSNVIEVNVDLETIYQKTEQENDYEYNYAIQERIDDLLDMKPDEKIFFQFNRDDKNDTGLIYRIE